MSSKTQFSKKKSRAGFASSEISRSCSNLRSKSELSSSSDKSSLQHSQVISDTVASVGSLTLSFTSPELYDTELGIVKLILLRESYIKRLQACCTNLRQRFQNETSDIMDLLRLSTVEVVEAIEGWMDQVIASKASTELSSQFLWNGIDYMLKIGSDLDFVHNFKAIEDWLGFSMTRNPFVISQLLIDSSTEDHQLIGGRYLPPNIRTVARDIKQGLKASPYAYSSERSFEADIVSKGDYIPTCGTLIEGDYLKRIRMAMVAIAKHEDKFGQYSRDPSGRLISKSLAEEAWLKVDLDMDDGRQLFESATCGQGIAAHASNALIGVNSPRHVFTDAKQEMDDEDDISRVNRVMDGSSTQLGKVRRINHIRSDGKIEISPEGKKAPARLHAPLFDSISSQLGMSVVTRQVKSSKRLKELIEKKEAITKQLEDLNKRKKKKFSDFDDDEVKAIEIQSKQTEIEIDKSRDRSRHNDNEADQWQEFQREQLESVNRVNALKVERKRRLLKEEDEKDVPGMVEDPLRCIEHRAATKIQKNVRRMMTKDKVANYKILLIKSSIQLQSLGRGFLDRKLLRSNKISFNAAASIQRVFRGHDVRKWSTEKLKMRVLGRPATVIQKHWRGVTGRKRHRNKRTLYEFGGCAKNLVCSDRLYSTDVLELANNIQDCMLNRTSDKRLNINLLFLLEIVCKIIFREDLSGLVTTLKVDESRTLSNVGSSAFTWQNANKILSRPIRFLRLLRLASEGPSIVPPRFVSVPQDALALFQLLEKDCRFCEDTMQKVGKGSKLTVVLFRWLQFIIKIFHYQSEFVGFMAYSPPEKMNSIFACRKSLREVEAKHAVLCRKSAIMNEMLIRYGDGEADDEANVSFGSSENYAVSELFAYSKRYNKEVEKTALSLAALKKEEESMAKVLEMEDEHQVDVLRTQLDEKKETLRVTESRYSLLVEDVIKNDNDAERARKVGIERQRLLQDKETVMRCEQQLLIYAAQVDNNSVLRRLPKSLDSGISVLCGNLGEAEAMHETMVALRDNYLKRQKKATAAQLFGTQRDRFRDKEIRAEKATTKKTKCLEILSTEILNYENRTSKLIERKLAQAAPVSEWGLCNEMELALERKEDAWAAEEAFGQQNMEIFNSILQDEHIARFRPVVVFINRDLPFEAKCRLLDELYKLFLGSFVRLESTNDTAVFDFQSCQDVLDSNRNVLIDVDVGLSEATRKRFMNAMQILKHCLVPSPVFVLVIGDQRNMAGIDEFRPELGISKADFEMMSDGDMKRSMEKINLCVTLLVSSSSVKSNLIMLATKDLSGSSGHILVLETVAILLSLKERSLEFKGPKEHVMGITWRATRSILASPSELAVNLANVELTGMNLRTLSILRQYISHNDWPLSSSPSLSDGISVLSCLVWNAVNYAYLATLHGYVPKLSSRHTFNNMIYSLVTVTDNGNADDNVEQGNGKGWRNAFAFLLSAVVEDVVVLRSTVRINGNLHNVIMSRESSHIFATAYDPTTSLIFYAFLHMNEISDIILNSAQDSRDKNTLCSMSEVYGRLANLLVLEKVQRGSDSRKELVFRNPLTKCFQEARYICGHLCNVSLFELSKGRYRCDCYLTSNSAKTVCFISEPQISIIQDHSLDKFESKAMESLKAEQMCRYLVDRVSLFPNLTTAMTSPTLSLLMKQNYVSSEKSSKESFGFRLSLRKSSLPGRLLTTVYSDISGVGHIIKIYDATKTNCLFVQAYNPLSAASLCVFVPSAVRFAVTECMSGLAAEWSSKLLSKLKILWLDKPKLYVDTCLFSNVSRLPSMFINTARNQVSTNTRTLQFKIDVELQTLEGQEFDNSDSVCICIKFCRLCDLAEGSLCISFSDFNVLTKDNSWDRSSKLASNHEEDEKLMPMLSESVTSFFREIYSPDNRRKFMRRLADSLRLYEYPMQYSNSPTVASSIIFACLSFSCGSIVVEKKGVISSFGNYHGQRMLSSMDDALWRQVIAGSDLVKPTFVKSIANIIKPVGYTVLDVLKKVDLLAKSSLSVSQRVFCGKPVMSNETNDLVVGSINYMKHMQQQAPLVDNTDSMIKTSKTHTSFEEAWINKISSNLELLEVVGSLSATLDIVAKDNTTDSMKAVVEHYNLYHHPIPQLEYLTADTELKAENPHEPAEFERQVFDHVVNILYEEEEIKWKARALVKAFDTVYWIKNSFKQHKYRFEVYDPVSSQSASYMITGDEQLSRVLGPHAQDLLEECRCEEMLYFVSANRIRLIRKIDKNISVKSLQLHIDESRSYSILKVTPATLSGDLDEAVNKDKLIKDREQRGRKIHRQAFKIDKEMLDITVFELPRNEEDRMFVDKLASQQSSSEPPANPDIIKVEMIRKAPYRLKLVAYNPVGSVRSVCIAPIQAVVEIAGGIYSPLLDDDRKQDLSRSVISKCKLLYRKTGPPTLTVTWTGDSDVNQLSQEGLINKRKLIHRSGMRICRQEAVMSVYMHPIIEGMICVCCYLPNAQQTMELTVDTQTQNKVTGNIISSVHEPVLKATMLRKICTMIRLKSKSESNGHTVYQMSLQDDVDRLWFYGYENMDAIPSSLDGKTFTRPTGYPDIFSPSTAKGALIERTGRVIGNIEVILSFFLRSEGSVPSQGIIVESYAPTSGECMAMHIGPPKLSIIAIELGVLLDECTVLPNNVATSLPVISSALAKLLDFISRKAAIQKEGLNMSCLILLN